MINLLSMEKVDTTCIMLHIAAIATPNAAQPRKLIHQNNTSMLFGRVEVKSAGCESILQYEIQHTTGPGGSKQRRSRRLTDPRKKNVKRQYRQTAR